MLAYFDARGSSRLPDRAAIIEAARRGTVTALTLDANVAIDLASFTAGRLRGQQRVEMINLLEYVGHSGVDVIPGFALAELSLLRDSWKLDDERMASVQAAVTYALQLPTNELSTFAGIVREALTPDLSESSTIEPFVPGLKLLYARALKMHQTGKAWPVSASCLAQPRSVRRMGRDRPRRSCHTSLTGSTRTFWW